MAQIIGLPKLSPTMEEGVLVRWVKKEGDSVEPGDLVAEVETDKANMDFTLEDEGVLLKLLVAEGDTVKLGAPVAILGEAGEDVAALEAEARDQLAGGGGAPAPAKPAPGEMPNVVPDAPKHPAAAGIGAAAAKHAEEQAAKPAPAAPAAPAPSGGRLLASPLAKTLAIDLGVDLRTVAGSGPGGRIVERDVRAASEAGSGPVALPGPVAVGQENHPAAAGIGAAAAEGSTALAVFRPPPSSLPALPQPTDEYVDSPLSNMRKTIAARMTAAKRDVPHFYLTRDFDAAKMLGFRKRLNELLGDRGKVSVNDLILKGVALALRRVPECNAAFMGDAIRYYTRVHLGVAVATERGLITPVIRNADLKGIGVIANEVKDLAQRAKDRQLKAHEISGSTFTVSNLGMYGIKHFEAIINPPEAGILALGAARDEAVVRDGQIVAAKLMSLTMSCDHRVIDGSLGARFLGALVDILEKPESLAL